MTCCIHRQDDGRKTTTRTSSTVPALLWCVALTLAVALAGCGKSPGTKADANDDDIRIVSFSPALSRTVVDLGLEDQIVGRTRYCQFLDDDVPIVGDLYAVDYERLLEINPTHILIQAPKEGVDERLRNLCEEHGWTLGQWTGINTIEDIETVVREMPDVLGSTQRAMHAQLSARAAELLNEIALALTPAGVQLWQQPVLLLYAVEPVGVFGRETYLNDVLVRLGATNVVSQSGWVSLTLEDVVQINPPAIVLIMPGAVPDVDVIQLLGPVGQLDIDAVNQRRVEVLSHPDSMYPSTGIIAAAKQLRDILAIFATIDRADSEPSP